MRLVVCLEGEVAGILEASGPRTHFTYSDPWLSGSGFQVIRELLRNVAAHARMGG